MNQLLTTSWGRHVVAALLGALLIVLLGLLVGTPPGVTLFAAALFGALLVVVVQLGLVVSLLWSSRGAPDDPGETLTKEIETPEGQAQLNHMSFLSLLAVATVQELHVSLYKRDSPIWAFEFFGAGDGEIATVDYGVFNRYLEWMLIIGLGTFTGLCAFLLAYFIYAVMLPPPQSLGLNAATLLCVTPAFFVGGLLTFPVGLLLVSIVRRVFILYSRRTHASEIE